MNKIKIGFVVPKYRGLQTKFSYGLEQNTYYLVSLFRSVPNYDVSYVLVLDNVLQESLSNQKELGDNTPLVEFKSLNPNLDNPVVYDVLIHIETYLDSGFIHKTKKRFKTKFVNVLLGCVMWGLMEDIIYDVKDRFVATLPAYSTGLIDEYWITPHYSYHKTYIETITKSPVAIIPYIYEPWFLQKLETSRKSHEPSFDPYYTPNTNKHIGILEANISISKNTVIPACIVESLYCDDPSLLDKKFVMMYGSQHLYGRYAFQYLFNYFESRFLFSSEARHPIVDILNYDCNLIISHQHLNALNYLYLDALYYNIPLVHNSDMIRDYGYYYPDFDVKKGSTALKLALETHDDHLEEYKNSASQLLHKFSTRNIKNIQGYKGIVKSLISRQ